MNELKNIFRKEQVVMWMGTRTSIDFGLFLLRLGIGGMMLVHGVAKMKMLFFGELPTFVDPLGIGVVVSLVLCVIAEVGCSVLLMVGLCCRLAALVLIINMSVAIFMVLGLSAWGVQELAVLYLLVYVVLLYTGPGNISLDAQWMQKKWGIGRSENKKN